MSIGCVFNGSSSTRYWHGKEKCTKVDPTLTRESNRR